MCNPHVGFPCENCEFNAKSYAGLKVHVKAKHKENFEVEVELTGNTEPELVAPVEKSVDENTFKYSHHASCINGLLLVYTFAVLT